MAGKLGKFQKLTFNHWKGLTKRNHLGAAFQEAPQQYTNLMVQLLALYRGKTLDTFLSQFPTKEFDSDDEYTWPVVGSAMRNIPLVEARDCDGQIVTAQTVTNIGVNGEPFYLVFGEDWFADGEVIVGDLNEVYPIRVLGEGRNEGTNTVYKVELMGGIVSGIPAERLLAGERFSVEYAPVERELSRQVGDIRFASPVAMRNEFSSIRIKHKVPGSMLDKKVAFGIPLVDANGNKRVENMWMHNVQWEFERQWNEYKNNLLAFGRSNRNQNGEYLNIGKSGEVIRMGAGLYEQMEVSNTDPYNNFSLKRFMDDLYQISRTKLEFGERKFIVKTGEMGAIQFSRAALSDGSGWSPITYEYSASELGAMKPVSSKMTPNGGAYRLTAPQVTEFIAPNGVYVKIDVDPFYDDPVRNKIQHPMGGPAMSYRYDIFDIGTMDQPNIFKVGVKGQVGDFTSYQWGFRNPFTGQRGNSNMSYDEDSAIIHKYVTTGVCVLDPTRTLSYIPAILVG